MTGSTKRPRGAPPGGTPAIKANRRESASKVCRVCRKNKHLGMYHVRAKKTVAGKKYRATNPRKYKSICKECIRAPSARDADKKFKPDRKPRKKARLLTPAEKRATSAAYKRKARREARIKVLEYLADKGCALCEERDPRLLEFDHLKPRDKVHAISKLLGDGHAWHSELLRNEIRKCRVLCIICHRLHTIEQMEYYSHDDVQAALRDIYAKHNIDH